MLRAAAWIVGEYSDIVTKIALDKSDEDDADDSEDEDGGGYWIEGPTGEDIRSKWSRQPVHAMAISALVNPRATNLPPHVQACYMQAAMKLFVRASLDLSEGQLVEIIGIFRTRLPIFLQVTPISLVLRICLCICAQSVDLEVQERSTSLRYLLDELGILPLDWEAQAEEEEEESDARKRDGLGGRKAKEKEKDLLFLPLYTSGSVKAVDEQGAKAAKAKTRVMKAIIAEKFFAVHSKAQRRVPVPENLNLENAFDEAALNRLLSIEEPTNLTLSSLSFSASVSYDEKDHKPLDEEEARISRLLKSSVEDEEEQQEATDNFGYTSYSGTNKNESESPWRGFSSLPDRPEERVFYLGGGGHPGSDVLVPETSSAWSDRKDKKKGKHKKRRGDAVNVQEMLPAGAVDSDEDDVSKSKGKSKGSARSSGAPVIKKKGNRTEEVMTLYFSRNNSCHILIIILRSRIV